MRPIDSPSPNFDARRSPPDMIILHYTGMPSAESAIALLCNPASEVSAHYVIEETGIILQLVPEARRAWHAGRALLEEAIAARLDYAFETTLGASTIPRLLAYAAAQGIEVRVWYAGLATPALHIARVRARVARGGHDIPEQAIRRRFEHSRLNLIQLMPALTALRVYDNSAPADPATGKTPSPALVLHMERGRIINPRDLPHAADWAKPIVAAAIKLALG